MTLGATKIYGWILCQVKELLEEEGGMEKVGSRSGNRASRGLVKHIIQQVSDTYLLNLTLKI